MANEDLRRGVGEPDEDAATTSSTTPAAGTTPTPPPPVVPPVRPHPMGGGGGTVTPQAVLRLLEAADQMVAVCTQWHPEGMLEVLEAYRALPDVLHRVAKAWQILHQHAADGYPLHPVVLDLVEALHRHQMLTAQSAEEIAPTARSLHARELEALQDPRNAMWDVRANSDRPLRPVPPAGTGS